MKPEEGNTPQADAIRQLEQMLAHTESMEHIIAEMSDRDSYIRDRLSDLKDVVFHHLGELLIAQYRAGARKG